LDPDIPLEAVATMTTVAASALARERFLMTLLGVFGALALLLACVGVYGVAAQGARTRTREIGIRMALGASRNVIVGQLVRRESLNAALGIFCGLVAALAGARVMQGFLYGVAPIDPITFVAVAGVLATVAVAASWWPARRATRVDPVAVLKAE
jgi:ABC-type antimicrobial peptide transport system permease subunit